MPAAMRVSSPASAAFAGAGRVRESLRSLNLRSSSGGISRPSKRLASFTSSTVVAMERALAAAERISVSSVM
jgi:hypothetical protein